MLLAIDTSTGTAVAVVSPDGTVLAEHGEPGARRHAEAIGTLIDACLRDAGIRARDVTGVAAGMGPGPFTGLRVGIAAARAFAIGADCPVIPVVSHDAAALDRDDPCVVVTDARRRELAWSRYEGGDADGVPRRVRGPELVPADGIDAVLRESGPAERVDVALVPAGDLGRLALRAAAAGRTGPGRAIYLRPPDVTVAAP